MKIKYPDYNNCILGIPAAVLKHYGLETDQTPLPILDRLFEKNYKNIVVMLFDGMGSAILDKHCGESNFLVKNKIADISSVYPPTTTAALTSMETGLPPITHGWLGWSMYFKELDTVVNLFRNDIRGSEPEQAADYHVARRFMPYTDIFTRINASGIDVKASRVSLFSEYETQSIDEICGVTEKLCNDDGRQYIYTYWHEPDYSMHEFGTSAEIVKTQLKEISEKVERLTEKLHDTLIILTADHGMIDVEFDVNYAELEKYLLHPLSFDDRSKSIFVKPEYKSVFREEFSKLYGDRYLLLSRDEILAMNLYGYGEWHEKTTEFIGDYVAVSTDKYMLDELAPESDKAAHAGLCEEEMIVPLIIIDKKK